MEFLNNVMDTLDQHEMKGYCLVMDNAAIYEVHKVQTLNESRGHKAAYLPSYSPFLNLIELFWPKLKSGIRRDCLTVGDNLTISIIESAKEMSVSDYIN